MNKKRGFIAYDAFKLIVAAILLFLIMILWVSFSKKVSPEDAAPAVAANVTEEKTDAAANADGADAATEALPTPQAEAEPELNLPAFPEPSEGLSFDAAKGILLDAGGVPLYRLEGEIWQPVIPAELKSLKLKADGAGWSLGDGSSAKYAWDAATHTWQPVIPAELKSLKLKADGAGWSLGDDLGAKYTWDYTTHSWLEVSQEQAAEDTAQDGAADVTAAECEGVAPPRLVAGGEAEVQANVNFRSSPGIADNWVTTLYNGTRLKVLGENLCLPYGQGAYRWWKLEQEDGTVGWMAEAPISGSNYFLAPAQ